MDAGETKSKKNYSKVTLIGDKVGCKGDPRMQRAVAARLANPNMTLFQALKVGGFDYAHDLESNVVDSENVTLCQRKHQLTRRVRLARQQQQQKQKKKPPPPRSHNDSRKKQPTKRAYHETIVIETECSSISKDDDDGDGFCLAEEDHMVNNDHPEEASPIPKQPQKRANAETIANETEPSNISKDDDDGGGGGRRSEEDHTGNNDRPNEAVPTEAAASSAVVISSLLQTAARVGLTLDQLALALQNCRTLTEVLCTSTMPNGWRPSRHDIAVALYQTEHQALYQHAMMIGGYPIETIITAGIYPQRPPTDYLQFVVACWQAEGQRLRTQISQAIIAAQQRQEQKQQEQIPQNLADDDDNNNNNSIEEEKETS